MKSNKLSFCVLILFIVLIPSRVLAQYSPSSFTELLVVEKYSAAQTDFPAFFVINTQALVTAGKMDPAGDDIRFSSDCPDTFLDYWIESGMNTDTTHIWIRIPQLAANDSLTIRMFYGDTAAAAASSFSATFPSALITTGNMTLSGTHYYGWLKVNSGHTITITQGQPLVINAEYAQIDGIIDGQGKGYSTPGLSQVGAGPGGGGTSTNAGSGGGGYGGAGGTGGYDSGDSPGAGGIANGTTSGSDIAMGSSGGSSDGNLGGSGGGSFTLRSRIANISGSLLMNGSTGQQPGGGRGGGGGAGGGIYLMADNMQLSGTLTANGGTGSVGTSTANDDGGGGGGGRIKIFHGSGYSFTGTTSTTGGAGGPNGTAAGGVNGQAGTVHAGLMTFKQNQVLGNYSYVTFTNAQDTICQGDSIFLAGAYQTSSGIFQDTLLNSFGCDSIVLTDLYVQPVDTSISITLFTLTAQANSATYQWYNCGTSSIIPGATGSSYTVSATGSYACIVTQDGCSAMSTCYNMTYNTGIAEDPGEYLSVYPVPAISMLSIKGFKPDREYELSLMDCVGRVYSLTGHSGDDVLTVPLSELPRGIYMLRIRDLDTDLEHTFRILRQ